jgi:hypothetical protein
VDAINRVNLINGLMAERDGEIPQAVVHGTREAAQADINQYIEIFCNHQRRYSRPGNPPAVFAEQTLAQAGGA